MYRLHIYTKVMIYFYLILSVLIGCGANSTQEIVPPSEGIHYYIGSLGQANRIQMELQLKDTLLTGWYYYEHIGKKLLLKGKLLQRAGIELSEMTNGGKITGMFHGAFAASTKIQGKWTIADGKGELPFELREVAVYDTIKVVNKKIRAVGTFPVFLDKNEPLTILSQAIRDSVETRVNNFLMLGKEYLTPDAPLYELGWDQSIECRIHFFSPELISLLISISEYTGGAHGNLRFRTLNYTSIERNFRELTLNELFLPNSNYVDILSRLCVNDLKIQGASLITSQQVKTFSESDFSEFTINPAGLTIYFAPYEVGAYAEGPYQVFIPFNLLKDVIDWNGPLGVFKHLYKITNSGS